MLDNKKGWFSPKAFPLVSMFAELAPSQVFPGDERRRELQLQVAIDRIFPKDEPLVEVAPLRSYQLPQPRYATLQDVRLRLGSPAASVLENFLCGETKTLDGMSDDEKRIARAIASVRGVQLP